jgi:hypothetical protein
MKTLLKRNFESTASDFTIVPFTIEISRESNSSDFIFFPDCTYSEMRVAKRKQISHRSGMFIKNFLFKDQDSELTQHSMELSMNSFKELWENEDDNYWKQYL